MKNASTVRRCSITGRVCRGLTKKVMAWVLLLIATSMLSSCATPLPAGESAVISVSQVQQGKVEKGLPVRWGGTIAEIHNEADVTVLEIVSRPLLRSGRPLRNDQTDGRFKAEISGFLDPEVVSPGRDISVIGTIDRVENGKVGEAEYRYPVMAVFDYQFWKKQSEAAETRHPNYLFSDDYWRDWPHRRRYGISGRVIF